MLGTFEIDGDESGMTEVASDVDFEGEESSIGLGEVGLDLAKFDAKPGIFAECTDGDSAGEETTRSLAGEE